MISVSSKLRLTLLMITLLVAGCATVPITNRRQITLIPSSQMLNLSQQQYQTTLQESQLSTDQKKIATLRKVGERIARAVDEFYQENGMPNNFVWEYNLIDDDKMVNAWAMPGGKIAFYTGIWKFTKDETGIATVMGHEVAHAIAEHGNERMSQSLLAEAGTTVLSLAMQSQPALTQRIFNTAMGIGTQVGILLPFSRLQESEADRIGLILMAKAGYDPRRAVEFWERMRDAKTGEPPELLSTHPSDQKRINNIQEHLTEALTHYKP